MYSIVLFIVETSLSGFFGSGDRPRSAVDITARTIVVRHPAGELDVVAEPELVAQRDDVVEAVTAAHQRERDVGAPELVHDVIGRADDDVDAVLRSHHADVGDQVAVAAAERLVRLRRGATCPGPGRCGPR